MRCEDCRQKFADLVEGLLPGPERVQVDQHAAGCAGCGADLASLRLAVTWLQTDVSLEPPADLCANVMGRIAASGPVGHPVATSPNGPKPAALHRVQLPSTWLLGAMAAGLVASVGLLALVLTDPPFHVGTGRMIERRVGGDRPGERPADGSSASSGSGATEPSFPETVEFPGQSTAPAPGHEGTVKPEAAPRRPTAPVANFPASPPAATIPAASDLGPAARPVTRTMPAATATTATPPRTGPASSSAPRPGPVRTIGDGF